MSMDIIEKKVVLHASLERVWRAISEPGQFGRWFGMEFDGPFAAGERVTGRIRPTEVDAEIARLQEPCDGLPCALVIEAIEPMRRFAFRWHPYAVEADVDYEAEPMTLVEFELEEIDEGVHLTITESGFDRIPLERRAKAFTANEGGWKMQVRLIARYLAMPADA